MCKVFIGESEKKLGFVLYNHLYTRKKRDFTTFDLVSELEGYNLTFTQENLQNEIDVLINNGTVSQRVGHYTCLL
ncbi:MAG: hypothetical protein IKQ33_06430 [Clostridia bacterium]|nr:hypothetical protein [Clostridia bacterium]